MECSGAGGKLIHEKNQKQKISWHCPFKVNTTYKLKSGTNLQKIRPSTKLIMCSYKKIFAMQNGPLYSALYNSKQSLNQIVNNPQKYNAA
jgi:hypothetical protein